MVNNFDKIKELLDFTDKNTFYFIQIIKRRKDVPEMKSGVSIVDNFYVYSLSDLDKLKEKIIDRCEKHSARAYINLNRLDTEKIALHTVKIIMDYIINKDYTSVKNAYATACGSHHSEDQKRWVIDVDEEALHIKDKIVSIIETLHKDFKKKGKQYKVLAEIPTRTGIHIITNPFNPILFQKEIEILTDLKIDLQKNSPTVLFIPDFKQA